MTAPVRPSLSVGRPCLRCGLASHDKLDQREGWCGFCRAFADDPIPLYGRRVFRLMPDHGVRRCDPARLGNWERTGREAVAYSTLELRSNTSALLKTVFLCVDYWPCGAEPLLFETTLVAMATGRTFDGCTRRYRTYDEALAGHQAMAERLGGAI